MKVGLFVLLFCVGAIKNSNATHATGADLTYQTLGNGKYLVTFSFYRDCVGISAPPYQYLYIKSTQCSYSDTVQMHRVANTGTEITHPCSTAVSTCSGGTVAGIQQWKFTAEITLPMKCSDWHFFTSVTNRNAAITTIVDPDASALYVEAFLNNSINENNSPAFLNVPVAFECIGQTNNYNQGVIDPDGDSLVYSFIAPRKDAVHSLDYMPGYSVSNPIMSSPAVSINSVNGDIAMNPIRQDIAAVAVLVKEFRGGTLIGSVMRDMQLYIVACSNALPVVTGINGSNVFAMSTCVGKQICFNVNSNDLDHDQALTMSWNHGISGATFTTTGTQYPVGHFCWAPSPNDAREQPYTFSISIRDNACPSNGLQTFSYSILVSKLNVQVVSTPEVQCAGTYTGNASATSSGTPPFQYAWTLPNGRVISATTLSHLGAGNYSLKITDENQCTNTKQFSIAEPFPLKVAITPANAACDEAYGSAMANVTGGTQSYNYVWMPGGQTNQNATNLTTNTYTVKVTDNHGCTTTASSMVMGNVPVSFALDMTGATCLANDGSATVTHFGGTGNFSYMWTPDIPGNTTTSTLTGLVAGGYTVVVTDLGTGCSQTLSGIVQNLAGISASITSSSNTTCESDENGSATVLASGGQPPYSYLWPNGDETPSTNHLSTGNHLVMTEDYNGCRAYAFVNIGYNHSSPKINLGADTIITGSNSYMLDAGQGYSSYLWNNGSTASTFTATTGGTYSVMVTNTVGCQGFDAVKITFNNNPVRSTPRPPSISSEVNIYPNPVRNELNININRIRNSEVQVTITDILGNIKFESKEQSAYGFSKKVDMEMLPPGIYLVKLTYDDESKTTRIIKQ